MEKTDDLGWELTQANGLSLCIKAAGPSVLQENEISATCAQAPTQLVWAVNSGYIRPHSQTSGFFFVHPSSSTELDPKWNCSKSWPSFSTR